MTTLSRVKTGLSNCLDLSVRLNRALDDGVSALVGCDYERLLQLAPEQEKLAFELRRCEQDLRGDAAALSREIGYAGELKLPLLLASAEGRIGPDDAGELSALAQKLRESAAQTAELTVTTKALLGSLNTYVGSIVKLLLGVEETFGYGGVAASASQRHLVDQRL